MALKSSAYPFKLSRHDHHNLELKSAFELEAGSVAGKLEVFLFMPGSVQLKMSTKAELMSDFRSRVRLAIPSDSIAGESTLFEDLSKLEILLNSLRAQGQASANAALMDEVFATARHVGAVFGELLKRKASLHKRELLLCHSLASCPIKPSAGLVELAGAISRVDALIDRQREVVLGGADHAPVLRLLDQYVHQLYVEYLSRVRSELDRIVLIPDRYPAEIYGEGWAELKRVLDQLQAKEAESLRVRWDTRQLLENEVERELHLLKQSQLKKFFQSNMFVEVTRRESIKRFTEPAATSAACLAALAGAALERFGKPHGGHLGSGEIILVIFGVALYVLKDRFKDRGKVFLTNRLSKVVPDVQQELVAESSRIGVIKEWFATAKRAALPKEVLRLRSQACVSDAEHHLPEDVLHYRRAFELRPPNSSDSSPQLGLQENLRINLQRYLKHMDDPYKAIQLLDPTGQFAQLTSHRVYHFYVCIVAALGASAPKRLLGLTRSPPAQSDPAEQEVRSIFRVVMDKNGIDRVERVV